MNDHPVFGQVALGYSPMVDRHRAITASRLTVFPSRPDTTPNVADLLAAVAEVWPADGGRVSLNVVSETAVARAACSSQPAPNVMVEIPAFMACDPANSAALQAMHAAGSTLIIKGRPLSPVAARSAALLRLLDHRSGRRAPRRRAAARRIGAHDPSHPVRRAHAGRPRDGVPTRRHRRARLADRRRDGQPAARAARGPSCSSSSS